jgi:phage terminase large subunit
MDRLVETNPNYYNIYALGQWWVLEWMIFEGWDIIQEIPSEARFIWYGQDFGFTNDPTTLIWVYIFNNELLLDELIYERWLTNQDIVKKYKELWIKVDDTIWADCAEPKSIEEIYREWYNIKPAEKGKDSIMFGIDTMKQYKIKVTAKSWNLHKELKKYVWAKDKNWKSINKPIDAFNHWIDWARYCCMMELKSQQVLDFYVW